MKKFLLTFVTSFIILNAWAYDFQGTDGFYYNITSSTSPYTVAVTNPTGSLSTYNGAITIPSTTTHNGITYSVTAISNKAFYENANGTSTKITSVIIPEGITSIGASAFSTCIYLTSVTIPSTVTFIGQYAFNGCCDLTSVTIPSGVSSIDVMTFQNCTALTSVILPSTITSINQSAFYGCTALPSVTIPSGVKTIGLQAFENCTSLTSITIPSSVTSIQAQAFYQCSKLATINCLATTPPTITATTFPTTTSMVVVPCSSIDAYKKASYWSSFSNYSSAAVTFTIDGIKYQSNASCGEVSVIANSYSGAVIIPSTVTYNGSTYNVTAIGGSAFSSSNITSINLPDGLTTIGNYAFAGCSHITSLTIPANVTSIGEFAFIGCTGLTTLTVSSPKTVIGYSAFYSCSSLSSLTIPSSVIGERAFYSCTGLSTLVIPSSVNSIGKNAFTDCIGLTTLTISSSNNAIGEAAFTGCTGLTSLTIPSSVIATTAFAGCTGLTSVVFSSSVTSIGSVSFYGCTKLSSVKIASSVTSIGAGAFEGCTGLASIYAKNSVPSNITMGSNVFYNVDKTTCILHVPAGTKNVYKAASQWNGFSNIVEPTAQTITFNAITEKKYGDSDFTISATGGASGNPVVFSSSDATVAKCTGTNGATIQIIGTGSCIITATQAGNDDYDDAIAVSQTLTVNGGTPTVTTSAVTDISKTTAICNGNITSTGGANITERGIYWSLTDGFADGTGTKISTTGDWNNTGTFIQAISELAEGTTYYVKAFAKNSEVISYGSQVSFTTSATLTAPGNTLNFDGIDDYVVATDIDDALTAFTIEAWVKWTPSDATDIQFICGKGLAQMELHTGGSAGANGIRFLPTPGVYLDAANVLPTGRWVYVTAVYDPSTLTAKMYIDGNEVSLTKSDAGTLDIPVGNTATALNIGRRSDNSFFFKGSIDEVRIWNTVRSQDEIQNDKVTSITTSPGQLCAFNFDEGIAGDDNTARSTQLPDLTGNGNNGTLINFAKNGANSNWVESYAMVVPTATTSDNITFSGFTANWTAPMIGTVDNYLLDVATDNLFTSPIEGSPFTIVSPALTKTIGGLSSKTTYYYRVRADKTPISGEGAWSNTIAVKTASIVTGENKIEIENVLIYLNTNNQITVICDKKVNNASITIYNAVGQKLLRQNLSDTVTVLNRVLNPGVYVVAVDNGVVGMTKKVVIK